MELTPTIQAQIKADALKSVRAVTNARTTNIFLHQEVLPAGHAVTNAVLRVPIARDTALVFVDLAPTRNWAHPCEYHLYDANTAELYHKVEASLPPAPLMRNPNATVALARAG